MTKRYDDPIEVELEEDHLEGLRPVAFWWRGRRYAVEGLLKYWREAGEGWDPQRARDHECFRVEAEGGVYDLRFDRLAGSDKGGTAERWRLARVWD
ncbi:MAG TPA: DUF6504 family protein [Actinomycetota bacterium]|nr:DUF6504 family protein [Actinomycetota bacterium]